MSQRVYWTEAEKMLVVSRVIELRQTRLFESNLEVFHAAQDVLPASRRRRIRTISEVPWFLDTVNETLKRRTREKDASDPAIPVIRDAQAVALQFFSEILTELRSLSDAVRKNLKDGK